MLLHLPHGGASFGVWGRDMVNNEKPMTKEDQREKTNVLGRMLDVPGKRRRGRQKTRWKDSCKRDMESKGGGSTGQDKVENDIHNHSGSPR